MDTSYCATRNHISVDRSTVLPDRPEPLSVYLVIRGCLFGVVAWPAAATALLLLIGWQAGASLLVLFLFICVAFFIARKLKGHTVKCSLLGSLSGTLRLTDLIS